MVDWVENANYAEDANTLGGVAPSGYSLSGHTHGQVYGAWELVTEETVSTLSQNFPAITGLSGDTDEVYRFICRIRSATASAAEWGIRFNADSGLNYGAQLHYAVSTGSTAIALASQAYIFLGNNRTADNTESFIEGIVSAKSGWVRQLLSQSIVWLSGTTVRQTMQACGAWNNSADELTSIQIVSNLANSFDKGYIALWKMKH